MVANSDYLDFLTKVSSYGHGVFTLSMLECVKARSSLRKYLQRNPSFFHSIIGSKGDLTIYILTKSGQSKIGSTGKITKAEQFASLADMALINAFMFETLDFFEYSYCPHLSFEIRGKKIGILSHVWGPTSEISKLDYLIGTKSLIKLYLENKDLLKKISVRDKINISLVKEIISGSYTPKLFL